MWAGCLVEHLGCSRVGQCGVAAVLVLGPSWPPRAGSWLGVAGLSTAAAATLGQQGVLLVVAPDWSMTMTLIDDRHPSGDVGVGEQCRYDSNRPVARNVVCCGGCCGGG